MSQERQIASIYIDFLAVKEEKIKHVDHDLLHFSSPSAHDFDDVEFCELIGDIHAYLPLDPSPP